MTMLLAAALGALAPAITPSPTMMWLDAGLDVPPAQDELPLRPSLVPS